MPADLNWLLGCRVTRVAREGEGPWYFEMGDHVLLSVECVWQILADGHVALGSGDHGQWYGLASPVNAIDRATELLDTRKVVHWALDNVSGDLNLQFEGAVVLRTFNDSSGYEAWQLTGPGGIEVVVQGGGNVVYWGR